MEPDRPRVAIVTGAGAGIGAASARALARAAFRVVVADIDQEAAARVADAITTTGGEALAVRTDISDARSVQALMTDTVAAFGGIDVLHNNAAETGESSIRGDSHVVDLDLDVLDRAYAVNVRGTVLCCKHAIPHMVRGGGGSIINTSSNSSTAGGLSMTAYGITKGAVNVLTKYVATQYGRHGIRCNAIIPGLTLTPSVERNLDPDEVAIHRSNLLARSFASPDDIATLVGYLATAPEYLTGEIITIDGGRSAHTPVYAAYLDRGRGVELS